MSVDDLAKNLCLFVLGVIFGCLLCGLFIARSYTEISDEILEKINQSTNIVEALKKENLIIKRTVSGVKPDTVEIVVEYDFLYKNSRGNNNEKRKK
jgi:hypothetical protein